MSNEAPYTNRLIQEKSPYLLQHAHNPVDWYPWGEEAFKAAQEQQKPIFLSIGYSTCHWCHVMEKESFENPAVAALMNKAFINIKVDREELPAVDSLYMEFAQNMVSGSLGWPLNVILTPDLHPFFATTYLPPYTSHGLIGLTEFVERIHEMWSDEYEREKLETQSHQIIHLFEKNIFVKGEDLLPKEEILEFAEILFKMADSTYGGMLSEPKFPLSFTLQFLLNFSSLTKDSRALFIVERTLDMMHRGGIYDHLGGGFSRYSVDDRWFLPHFEKMLYDNALLAKAYFLGWQTTKKGLYKLVSDQIFHYLMRDMMFSKGGFYAAEDADSEGHEGLFYTWQYDEVQQLLGEKETLFCEFYSIAKGGNFEGRSILHTPLSLEEFALKKGLAAHTLEQLFRIQREILWKAREKRVHPFKDTKIITSWNALMLDALACATDYNDSNHYMEAAKKSANFIKTHFLVDNILKRRWVDGESSFFGGLEDYAFMIKGLLSMFEADGGTEWLQWAMQLAKITNEKFKSPQGAYFQTSEEEKDLILRKCQFGDGAEPSGNSVQCENMLRLYDLTGEEHYLEAAEEVLKASERYVSHYPMGYLYHLMNFNHYYATNRVTLVIALNEKLDYRNEIFELLYNHFIPHKAIIWRHEGDAEILKLLPALREQIPIEGKTTLYICHQGYCKSPLTSFPDMEKSILAL